MPRYDKIQDELSRLVQAGMLTSEHKTMKRFLDRYVDLAGKVRRIGARDNNDLPNRNAIVLDAGLLAYDVPTCDDLICSRAGCRLGDYHQEPKGFVCGKGGLQGVQSVSESTGARGGVPARGGSGCHRFSAGIGLSLYLLSFFLNPSFFLTFLLTF